MRILTALLLTLLSFVIAERVALDEIKFEENELQSVEPSFDDDTLVDAEVFSDRK